MSVTIILIVVTLTFMSLDIVTGLLKCFKEHNFKSSVMRDGGFKKCALIILLVVIFIIDNVQIYAELGFHIPLFKGVSSYIMVMEIGSILENLCKIEPKIKKVVKNFLGGALDE